MGLGLISVAFFSTKPTPSCLQDATGFVLWEYFYGEFFLTRALTDWSGDPHADSHSGKPCHGSGHQLCGGSSYGDEEWCTKRGYAALPDLALFKIISFRFSQLMMLC